ncbi:MAG TPA: class II fructose-bisphosphate aldolase [Firmicutes bacterium]|nr:class II fructose-bisphosphate aldolase [Bacillota bacterium]
MPAVPMIELLNEAYKGGYALGAFNVNNLEMVQAVIEVAEEERSPVIIQAAPSELEYAGWNVLPGIVKSVAEDHGVTFALHLDHGRTFDDAIRSIRSGLTSVMIDCSTLPLRDNIAQTREIVKVAHAVGVTVEAELGRIGGEEFDIRNSSPDAFMTDPEEARNFVEETGVDTLAVAIGTAHGLYKYEPRLDFDRLDKINRLLGIPLVLHGGTGLPEQDIKRAVSLGVAKLNISTASREAFIRNFVEFSSRYPENLDLMKTMGHAKESMKRVVRSVIRMLGSSNRV